MSKVDLVSEKLDFASEDDLWKLFRTTTLPEDGHKLPGERAHEFCDIWDWLHYRIDGKAKRRPLFNLKCDDRFYYLRSRSAVAVVPQSALLKVGRVMRDRVTVQYLGTDPKSDGGCAAFNPDKDLRTSSSRSSNGSTMGKWRTSQRAFADTSKRC